MSNPALFEPAGRLFFGDNLEVLRRHVADESVDLVYLDPPFNSNRAYNVLFAHRDGRKPAAQVKAFDDTWRWDTVAAETYHEVVEGGGALSKALRAFRDLIGTNDMLAYLTMMAPRLAELHRVLKPTGSLYLHCDPTASHYLKALLDSIFGAEHFINEVVWLRTAAKGSTMNRLPSNHDVVLAYRRSDNATWHEVTTPYDLDDLDDKTLGKYSLMDPDGRRYQLTSLLHPEQGRRPNLDYEVMGVRRTWRWSPDRMKQAIAEGRVVQTAPGRVPREKRYLDEQKGRTLGDVWTDISPLNARAGERLGYPTQKPLALLERIIAASTDPGDVVLDPFCGCGTTIDAAISLNRSWIGIDVTALAIDVIRDRLATQHPHADYVLRGEPSSIDEAEALFKLDPHEFERWVCRRLGVKPATKKGSDRGIDGEFVGVRDDGSNWRALVSVKGGGVNVTQVRDLVGTITRERSEVGVFVTLKPPTAPMRREAADAGFAEHGVARVQILTVADLFDGREPALPASATPAKAGRRLRAV